MPNRIITKGQIGNALESVAPDHILGVANDIFDESLQMYQSEINQTRTTGGVYDISVANAVEGEPAKYSNLSSALTAIVSDAVKVGGMTVRYIQSSDNKYVQYRLMSDTFNTTTANWQGIDSKVKAESKNLVENDGIAAFSQKELGTILLIHGFSINSLDGSLTPTDSNLRNATEKIFHFPIDVKLKDGYKITLGIYYNSSGEQIGTTQILPIPAIEGAAYFRFNIGHTDDSEIQEGEIPFKTRIEELEDDTLKLSKEQSLSSAQKQNILSNLGLGDGTVDKVPTAGSANLIESAGVESTRVTLQNEIADIAGGDVVKSVIDSVAIGSNPKYGFWIPSASGVGNKVKVFCDVISDGTYNFVYANSSKTPITTSPITFSDGYAEMETLDSNQAYWRIYANAITTITETTKCYVLKTVNGKIHKIDEWEDFKQGKIIDTIDSEYLSGPNAYGFFVPAPGLSQVKTKIYCPDMPDGTYSLLYYRENKTISIGYVSVTFKDGISVIICPDGTPASYYRILDTITKKLTAESKCYILEYNLQDASEYTFPIIKDNLTELAESYSKRIGDVSTVNCAPYLFVGKSSNERTLYPKYNIILATDYHKDTNAFRNVCEWTKDGLINDAMAMILCSGDFINSGAPITEGGFEKMCHKVMAVANKTNKPILFCQGNHDQAWENETVAGFISAANMRSWIYNPMYERLSDSDKENFTWGDSVDGTSLYYSFKQSLTSQGNTINVKYIVLNEYETPIVDEGGYLKYNGTGSTHGRAFSTYISQAQMSFLISELSNAADSDVVFIVKHTPNGDSSLCGCNAALGAILTGYANRTSGSITVDAIEDIPSYTLEFDFTGKSESHIMVLCGHTHTTALSESANNVYGCYRLTGCATSWGGGTDVKAPHSMTETNCDIVAITPSNKKFMVLRYGVAKKFDGTTSSWLGLNNPYQL